MAFNRGDEAMKMGFIRTSKIGTVSLYAIDGYTIALGSGSWWVSYDDEASWFRIMAYTATLEDAIRKWRLDRHED